MTYLSGLEQEGVDPILLDGGDWLFQLSNVKRNKFAERQLFDKARLLVDAYNLFGYDAAAIGENDLAQGIGPLLALEEKAKFPFLCANLFAVETASDDASDDASEGAGEGEEAKETRTRLFPGSTVIEKNGKRIGVIGAIQTLSDRFIATLDRKIAVTDPIEAIRGELESLGEVDLVFLLGHIDRTDVDRIADSMPGVDFILEPGSYDGNESTWMQPHEEFIERNGRLLLKVSGQGSTIGRLDLYHRERGKPWLNVGEHPSSPENLYWPEATRLAPHIGRHPGVDRLVDEFLKSTRYQPLTEDDLQFEASEKYLTASTCGACHVEQTEFWRTTGHGKAYATLEATGDQFRYDCVSCHVLAYGETFVDAHDPGPYKDVQCESCHGTNPEHPTDPAAHPWPKVARDGCWSCHDPRVTRVEFDPKSAFPKVTCPPLKREE